MTHELKRKIVSTLEKLTMEMIDRKHYTFYRSENGVVCTYERNDVYSIMVSIVNGTYNHKALPYSHLMRDANHLWKLVQIDKKHAK